MAEWFKTKFKPVADRIMGYALLSPAVGYREYLELKILYDKLYK